jgi:outer membrane protein OmpA-like peptidoglycan-associated protein
MNNREDAMMKHLRQCLGMMVVVVSVVAVLCGAHGAWAETPERALEFPTNEEDIVKLLSVTPPDTIVNQPRGGVGSGGNDRSLFGGNTRGLAGIADDKALDDDALAQAPKVGALVLFDFDSFNIKDESRTLLEQFARAFQHPDLQDAVFVIAGHTDSRGAATYNLRLSEARANAVKQYLSQAFDLPEERFLIKPYGPNQPIASNDTDEGRAQNRRVEFIRVQ